MKRLIDLGYAAVINTASLKLYKNGMKIFEYNIIDDSVYEIHNIPISELELIVRVMGELGL